MTGTVHAGLAVPCPGCGAHITVTATWGGVL